MSSSIAAILLSILISSSSVFADGNVLATEMKKLEMLSLRTDLTIKEWVEHVDRVDRRCGEELNPKVKETVCSFYYDIYRIGELFKENPIDQDECDRYLFTNDSISKNSKANAYLKIIVKNLCPKPQENRK
jgi:hypothetical protein